jgi:hypothetical protein
MFGQGGQMRTVVVRVGDADFSNQMAEMREWLDRHRYEPVKFVYNQIDGALVISVQFPNAGEAEAFATRFDGQEPAQIIASLGESRPATEEVYSA